ncbi:hypothetical protein KBTX_00507 [wastewater metagenome]|uniref:DUF3149 domain-containing protein n=2 Tax=unclassified sequences TaxID=12908 RepID=A0A5B8R8D8_9ZZZZ|nr:DUF3149 domain-containing protein [Arhodomonas aquaeolei]MCS4504026.1 DUF3149 domain-containing protein [Arhodomonas aquaeolei]QEA04203.1 hypothetical protein KBTEX_00507 [uncultured organism]
MEALTNLLSGRPDFWLSLVVILFMLGMGGFFVVFFLRHIRREDAERRRH